MADRLTKGGDDSGVRIELALRGAHIAKTALELMSVPPELAHFQLVEITQAVVETGRFLKIKGLHPYDGPEDRAVKQGDRVPIGSGRMVRLFGYSEMVIIYLPHNPRPGDNAVWIPESFLAGPELW